MTGGRVQRPLWQVGFETGHAIGSDDRVVRGPGKQLEAIALTELDRPRVDAEADAAGLDDDHLVVSVVVGSIAVVRSVRPRAGVEALGGEACPQAGVGHGRGMVPATARRQLRRHPATADSDVA